MAPTRTTRGSPVKSTIVDGVRRLARPPSTTPASPCGNTRRTSAAERAGVRPERLALVPVSGVPAARITARANSDPGNRTATVPLPAVTMPGTRAAAGRISVSGPGQNRAARRSKDSGSRAASSSTCRRESTSSRIGFDSGRPFSRKSILTASGWNGSAASPYTVSVGIATTCPRRMAAAACLTVTPQFYYDGCAMASLLQDVRRAIARGVLTSDGLLPAETFHLWEEARRSGLDVPLVIAAAGLRQKMNGRVRVVSDRQFRQLGSTETAQGIIALVRPPQWKLDDLFRGVPLVVVLDGLQDPGNAGAIVRAAEAFGASGVLFLTGTVSPFNSKVVRASAGSLFRVPFVAGLEAAAAAAALGRRKICIHATGPRGGVTAAQADLRSPSALIIGSEARGVSDAWRGSGARLRIPTRGVESLNAALSAAVLLYEASRQRQ